ncbi:permease [Persephonella sp.]
MDIITVFEQFINKFLGYSLEILPYFFIATVIGAFIQSYVSFNFVRKFINKDYSPAVTALFGSSVPVCSCSMIPIAQTINSLSKSYAPAVAFLISAPILSPVVFFLMIGMFGWKLTIFRFVFGFLTAVITAYIVNILFKKPPALPMISSKGQSSNRWQIFKTAFKEIFIGTGRYVLIGLLIASAVAVLIPSSVVVRFSEFPFSYIFIAVFSIPIYVCSGEEIPIAKSFFDLGFSQGQALTFMFASAGICIPTISATFKIFPKKLAVFYVLIWFFGSTAGGILFDLIFKYII